MELLTATQIRAAHLEGWQAGDGRLQAQFATGSFQAGLEFVTAIAAASEEVNHHPDVTLTYPAVGVCLTTHDASGITQLDLDLARRISGIAHERGIEVR